MRVLFVSLAIVIIDQVSKLFVKGFSLPLFDIHYPGISYAEQHEFLGSFLKITFIENPGMAFGIDLGPASKLFLSLFSIAASIGIVLYLYRIRYEGVKIRVALALILGGAIGNLVDRVFYGVFYGYGPLFYGKVVDFFQVKIAGINLLGYNLDNLPIFNVADISVTAGVILLVIFSGKIHQEKAAENDLNEDSKPAEDKLGDKPLS
ncbi:MAG: signal peptidase II [Ignavibacteria bacterium]|nr:signal peptidase II [Ignavibacteria bacterium]MCU7500678.1 signal peptidase II [Ignavibacteria bacterium]MCU7512844.1 signal peptidase II [Ignavibacteria bacterium]MCU7521826.1 signal peptidase II [Ignavibacteria bacterium]MCU7525693.1 signal peptidase II [Ignavibacteria bacterium]